MEQIDINMSTENIRSNEFLRTALHGIALPRVRIISRVSLNALGFQMLWLFYSTNAWVREREQSMVSMKHSTVK